MALSLRLGTACLCLLAARTLLPAQTPLQKDTPPLHVSVRQPSRQDVDHHNALLLYARGLMEERGNRFLEAVGTLEQALALEPDAAPVLRSLIPLYLALDRSEEARNACERVLKLDPEDCDTWYL